jgi:TPR repeat protein
VKSAALALALAACGRAATTTTTAAPPPAHLDCGERRCLDLARDRERGHGGPRDFTAALAAYRTGCDHDDALACRLAGLDLFSGVGAPPDGREAERLLTRGCELGDATSCAYLGLLDHAHDKDLDRLGPACEGGDADACFMQWAVERILVPDCDDACFARERDFAIRACDGESLEGCGVVLDLGAEVSPAELARAHRIVSAACDDGDVDACADLPGRRIDPVELCHAGDYTSCEGAGLELRDGAEPRVEQARALLDLACDADLEVACRALADPELATGCATYAVARTDPADRPTVTDAAGHDGTGTARTLASFAPALLVDTRRLHVDPDWPQMVAPVPVVAIVNQLSDVPAGVTAFVLDAPDAWLGFHGMALVDATGVARATLELGPGGPTPSLGRCVASLLAEP